MLGPPCRTAREIHWFGTVPSGHLNVHCQWGPAQARSARGGAAAAAVLGRHGGGWVATARGSAAVRVQLNGSCGPNLEGFKGTRLQGALAGSEKWRVQIQVAEGRKRRISV